MNNTGSSQTTKAGTVCGTLLTILGNLQQEDIVKTVILAAVGALVSFSVSIALKHLKDKFFR